MLNLKKKSRAVIVKSALILALASLGLSLSTIAQAANYRASSDYPLKASARLAKASKAAALKSHKYGGYQNAGACSDSDGYRSFYTKGSAYGWHQQGKGPELKWWDDYCIGDYAYDFTCKTNKNSKAGALDVWAESFKCPHGCSAGACLAQPLPLKDLSVKDLSASNSHNNYFIATIKGDNISGDFEIKWQVDGVNRKTETADLGGTDGLYGLALPNYVTEGWHTVSISVDTKNQISESNEANNSREIRFYLYR